MIFRQVSRAEMVAPFSAVWNLEYPQDLRSPDEVGSMYLVLMKDAFEEHWVGEVDRPVCVISAFDYQAKSPVENLNVEISIDPRFENDASEALDFIDKVAERSGTSNVAVWSSDLLPGRVAELERRGYGLIQTVPVTRLDITTFDAAPFVLKRKEVGDQGIRLTTIAELEREGFDWPPSLHAAAWEMVQDMPRSHEVVQPPFEQWVEMLKNKSTYIHDLMFAAVADGRIVAYSRVVPGEAMKTLVRTGLSGVVRDYRRRGVITALKVMQIERLRQLGYTALQTDNDERNAMFGLNLQLGFKVAWRWVQLERARC